MSTATEGTQTGDRSAEERAEHLMERVTAGASRFVTRFVGRAREEFEDMLAEARSLNHHDDEPG